MAAFVEFMEGAIHFLFANAVSQRKFDEEGSDSHGLSHCMKAVDRIVEFEDRLLFVEVKDPQGDQSHTKEENEAFVNQFTAGKLDDELKYKYRDSFLYECASNRYEWVPNRAEKPIHYYVLFADETLDSALLSARSSALESQLPINGPRKEPWPRPFVHGCGVFNIASWNKYFPDCPVTRMDAPGTS